MKLSLKFSIRPGIALRKTFWAVLGSSEQLVVFSQVSGMDQGGNLSTPITNAELPNDKFYIGKPGAKEIML